MTIKDALGILRYVYSLYGDLEIVDLNYVEKKGWIVDNKKSLIVINTEKLDGHVELRLAFMYEPEEKPKLTLLKGGDDER